MWPEGLGGQVTLLSCLGVCVCMCVCGMSSGLLIVQSWAFVVFAATRDQLNCLIGSGVFV